MTLKRKILLVLAIITFIASGVLYYHTTKNLISHEEGGSEASAEGE